MTSRMVASSATRTRVVVRTGQEDHAVVSADSAGVLDDRREEHLRRCREQPDEVVCDLSDLGKADLVGQFEMLQPLPVDVRA